MENKAMSYFLTKERLEEYWEDILEKTVYRRKKELLFFTHCTTLTGRKGICSMNTVIGYPTDMPSNAPLSRNSEIKGVWFEVHPAKLPTSRSPFGNRRLTFKTKTLFKLLSPTSVECQGDNKGENINSSHSDYYETGRETGFGEDEHFMKKEKVKKKTDLKGEFRFKHKYSREDFLKDDAQTGRTGTHKNKRCDDEVFDSSELPVLFFECCHFYGNKQYLRFIMIKRSDKSIGWCNANLKWIDIRDNPIFKYCPLTGRLFAISRYCEKKTYFLHILVVGDIQMTYLSEDDFPKWDKVTKMRKSGRDPTIGIVSNTEL